MHGDSDWNLATLSNDEVKTRKSIEWKVMKIEIITKWHRSDRCGCLLDYWEYFFYSYSPVIVCASPQRFAHTVAMCLCAFHCVVWYKV